MITTETPPQTLSVGFYKYHSGGGRFVFLFMFLTWSSFGIVTHQGLVSVSAVPFWRQHVPVPLLSHPDQVPGHGEHAVWSDSSSFPQANRKDNEEGIRGESGAQSQTGQMKWNWTPWGFCDVSVSFGSSCLFAPFSTQDLWEWGSY